MKNEVDRKNVVVLHQVNATFGTCDVPVLPPPPPSQLSPTGREEDPVNNSASNRPQLYCSVIVTVVATVFSVLLY